MSQLCLPSSPRLLSIVAALLGCLIIQPPRTAHAQPRVQTIGETVADRDSPDYRFERFAIDNPDGRMNWRVYVAIPKAAVPARGFPAFWMLDGNGALMEFDDALLGELRSREDPRVLVFIAHDSDLRFESRARYRDYTPTVAPKQFAEERTDRPGGGADAFLDVILDQIRPRVNSLVKLDPHDQAIWGHSLGGIFVLNALFKHPDAFETYIAGSPSMWWGRGQTARDAEGFIAHSSRQSARVMIFLGEVERKGGRDRRRDTSDPRVAAHLERRKGAPPDAAAKLAESLKKVPGLDVTYREFPGLSHGPMFRASLMAGLRSVTGIAAQTGAEPPGEDQS